MELLFLLFKQQKTFYDEKSSYELITLLRNYAITQPFFELKTPY